MFLRAPKLKAQNGGGGSPKKRNVLATLAPNDLHNVKMQAELVNQAALAVKMYRFAYNDTLRRMAEKYGLPEQFSVDLETGESFAEEQSDG